MANKAKPTAETQATARIAVRQKFTVEKLAANCRRLFGVSASTFAGATYGMTGEYTVEEMKAHIEAWGKRGVK